MMSPIPISCPGCYGKIPSLGDFVRRMDREFIDPWDQWLQDCIVASKQMLGGEEEWLDVYLTSPIWRFGLSAGVCGTKAWVGVLMPSMDRVERYFPFTLAAPLDSSTNLFRFFEQGNDWFSSLESIALSVLENDLSVEVLESELEKVGSITNISGDISSFHFNETLTALGQTRIHFHLEEVEQTPNGLASLTGWLINRCLPRYTLWTTSGSERVDATILLREGLPPAHEWAAWLTGQWES